MKDQLAMSLSAVRAASASITIPNLVVILLVSALILELLNMFLMMEFLRVVEWRPRKRPEAEWFEAAVGRRISIGLIIFVFGTVLGVYSV